MQSRSNLALLLLIPAMFIVSACAPVAMPVRTVDQLQTEWLTDIELGSPMQDVYVEGEQPGMVVRFEEADLDTAGFLAESTYRSTTANAPDLFMSGPNPLGPFPAGDVHPFTVGEWIDATGSGTYTVEGDQARMDFSFENLVPDSVYTVWCMTIDVTTEEMDEWPCGAPDGSESIFHSDADGNGHYLVSLEPLPEATEEIHPGIAIAYHSDGQTYGEIPGDYGMNVHIQLSAPVPPADGPDWQEFLIVDAQ